MKKKNMNCRSKKNNLFHYVIVASLLSIATKVFVGNFYEAYEFMQPAMLSGIMTDGIPADFFAPYGMIGLGKLYKCLYLFLPKYPWYDIITMLYIVTACAVFLLGIDRLLSSKFSREQIFIVTTSFFFLFITDVILNWSYTRTASLLCVAAFGWHQSLPNTIVNSNFKRLSASFLFLLGTLIRPEIGELMAILIFGYLFWLHGVSKKTIVELFPFLIPALFVFAILAYTKINSGEFYDQFESSMEFQIASKNIVGIDKMKTAEDSAKYIALSNGIVNDPSNINIQFVKRVLDTDNANNFFNKDRFIKSVYILSQNIRAYSHIVFACFVLTVYGFILVCRSRKKTYRFIAFLLYYTFVVFTITYTMTMEARLFDPLLLFFSISVFYFIVRELSQRNTSVFKRSKPIGIILLTYCIISQWFALKATADNYMSNLTINHKLLTSIRAYGKDKILVPDAYGFMILYFDNYKPFQRGSFDSFKNVFLMDMETFSLKPDYRTFLNKNCNCNSTNLGQFYNYLYENKDDVIFLSCNKRLRLFESYLKTVHKKNYRFKLLANLPDGVSKETTSMSMFIFE